MGNSLFKRYQHIKCPWFSGVSHLPSNDYYLFSLFSMQFGFYLHRLHFCSPNVPKFDEKHKVKSLHSQSLHPHILEEVETKMCLLGFAGEPGWSDPSNCLFCSNINMCLNKSIFSPLSICNLQLQPPCHRENNNMFVKLFVNKVRWYMSNNKK